MLNLDDKPGLVAAVKDGRVDLSDSRVTVKGVAALIFGLVGWLWAMFGAGSGAVAKDYVNVRDRVTVLEAQRVEDVKAHERQREDEKEWRKRVDEKLDQLVEWVGNRRTR